MPVKSSFYEPLLDKDGLDGDSEQATEPQYQPPAKVRLLSKRASIPVWMIASVAFLQVVTMFILIKGGLKSACDYANPQMLYSPAEKFIEYEIVKFRSGLNGEGDDIYSLPPSDDVDAAWEDLYNFGVSEINEQQAMQLANVTMQVPNSDDKYVMLLDVFHELHCICSSDISTIVWHKPEGEREGPRFDIIHSCRNFEKIKSWAAENRGSIYVKDGRISATPDGFKDEELDMGMEHHHHGHHHHDGA
ncbi:hypothetical protein C0995_001855 [Termitomyces sp. Mi166|nr:hypothetical protein C0995_001855 [Termitomyces sp. Mi166\